VVSVNLPLDVHVVARGGRVVCTGQGPSPEATLPIGEALGKDVSLLFMNLNNAGRAGVARIAGEIAQMVADGRVKPVIGEQLPLAEARRAHELLAGHHLGKIVLLPRA
jgi:NADPH:quinone reductase-like Zn-dependent oxidoreductase